MKRAFILLFDSFGIGAADDAETFGDQGADTFGHIAQACLEGRANNKHRTGPLHIPNLTRLSLLAAHQLASQQSVGPGRETLAASYGYAQELSYGKDTPSGHWEIAGVPALFEWGYFPKGFPEKLINEFIVRAKIPGILGNHHASGTVIINELGDEHIKTGKPIIYTSGDSVFQIAAHEEHFGIERLYEICKIARELVDEYQVGRVIARPFLGQDADYYRTANRKDYATPPPDKTLLDKLVEANGKVIAIGKVADIFAHEGISQEIKADGNLALFDETLKAMQKVGDNTLVFSNFVDFDSKYGHRRDVVGYAKALEELDARLPEFEALMQPDDIAIITADHGCDPTLPGSDHTREYIPVLVFGPRIKPQVLGKLESFADIGQTLASYFDLAPFEHGKAFSL